MSRWFEALLLLPTLGCALLPALGRCDAAPRQPECSQARAPEDFGYLLAVDAEESCETE